MECDEDSYELRGILPHTLPGAQCTIPGIKLIPQTQNRETPWGRTDPRLKASTQQ